MGFGNPYTFEELYRLAWSLGLDENITLTVEQARDLCRAFDAADEDNANADYECGYQDGLDACEANHPKTAA